MDATSSELKKRGSTQFKSLQLWWYGGSSVLAVCLERSISAVRYIELSDMLPSRFFAYFNKDVHNCIYTVAWLCSRKVWVLNSPAVHSFHPIKSCIWHVMKWGLWQGDTGLLSSSWNSALLPEVQQRVSSDPRLLWTEWSWCCIVANMALICCCH